MLTPEQLAPFLPERLKLPVRDKNVRQAVEVLRTALDGHQQISMKTEFTYGGSVLVQETRVYSLCHAPPPLSGTVQDMHAALCARAVAQRLNPEPSPPALLALAADISAIIRKLPGYRLHYRSPASHRAESYAFTQRIYQKLT